MSLYSRARGVLKGHSRLDEHDAWCTTCSRMAPLPTEDGHQIVVNVAAEEHFAGPTGEPDPETYAGFLEAAMQDGDTMASFSDACKAHNLQGTVVPAAEMPPQAYRYVSAGVLRIWTDVVAKGRLPARDDELAEELKHHWLVYKRVFAKSELGIPGRPVFLAIPLDGQAPRVTAGGSAHETFALLGLPALPKERFELVIDTAGMGSSKVPTVADAGWFSYFRPAPAGTSAGMTWHREEGRAGVREAVVGHDARARLLSPPSYVHD